MITETLLPDGRWRYEGDGTPELVGTTEDGRYAHSVVHCGWVETRERLDVAAIESLFSGGPVYAGFLGTIRLAK